MKSSVYLETLSVMDFDFVVFIIKSEDFMSALSFD